MGSQVVNIQKQTIGLSLNVCVFTLCVNVCLDVLCLLVLFFACVFFNNLYVWMWKTVLCTMYVQWICTFVFVCMIQGVNTHTYTHVNKHIHAYMLILQQKPQKRNCTLFLFNLTEKVISRFKRPYFQSFAYTKNCKKPVNPICCFTFSIH